MSHDDVEAVQAIYDGFRQGCLDAIVARYDAEFTSPDQAREAARGVT